MPDLIQSRLVKIAALFLGLYSICLTLAPAVRERSWQVEFRWGHWIGFLVWVVVFVSADWMSKRFLPDRDPFLLPIGALLSGWGLLTIWRLLPSFGLRQSVWLLLSGLVLIVGFRLSPNMDYLRRYKYLWLSGAILLTGLTLIFGVNPNGVGPRMWLGCCGVYLQPSEPLKLLLIAYLAAYLADHFPLITPSIRTLPASSNAWLSRPFLKKYPFLMPTLLVFGVVFILLLVQRDLGTAFIFLFLFATILFLATGQKKVLWITAAVFLIAGGAGYLLFDVVKLRIDAWLHLWQDPAGRSYQIIQSLLAIANGGLIGRGPGVGNPGLVPLAHTDLIFSAIVEESGLLGAATILLLIALYTASGLKDALVAPSVYQRFLGAGLIIYLAGQSLLIIGGSLRVLPLTGVTLPFVSYGGSSLLTSFVALLLLIHISNQGEIRAKAFPLSKVYSHLGNAFFFALAICVLATAWWSIYRAQDLLARTDNPRRAIADRFVLRGAILDRHNQPINNTQGLSGDYLRYYLYPDLSNIVGYNHPVYGQSGLEQILDDYLRGLKGPPALVIAWNQLLYGQPPPGLDVRLSLDLKLQQRADEYLSDLIGGLVVINAENGEILIMSSHPTFDANCLEEKWEQLVTDPTSPLLNRAIQGRYPVENLSTELFMGRIREAENNLLSLLPFADHQTVISTLERPLYSVVEVALAAASISSHGFLPSPTIVTALNIPQEGWVILPKSGQRQGLLKFEQTQSVAQTWAVEGLPIWEMTEIVYNEQGKPITWFVGGTSSEWQGTPLAIGLVIEQANLELAIAIGEGVLRASMGL